jgi:hypothetical protein
LCGDGPEPALSGAEGPRPVGQSPVTAEPVTKDGSYQGMPSGTP